MNIHSAVNVQAVATDGVFRIGIKPREHSLHSGIVLICMVDIQKEVSFREDKSHTGSTDLFCCHHCLIISHPSVAILFICTGSTAIGSERYFVDVVTIHFFSPKEPDPLCF